jgi:hypothetical protein
MLGTQIGSKASWPFMDDAEPDVLACMTFPAQYCTELHSTNPIERLNGEIKRRTPPRSLDRASRPQRWRPPGHSVGKVGALSPPDAP